VTLKEPSTLRKHEVLEESGKLVVRVEREDICNILIRTHDDYAAAVAIDPAHVEDVATALEIGTEHLLIVTKPVPPLTRQKKLRHLLEVQLAMALLEHGSHVDNGIDIRARGCVAPDRGLRRAGEEFA
jgi:hypothetical protein